MPHRFFVQTALAQNRALDFDDAHARQIREVLRMRVGDQVIVLDNAGLQARVALREINRAHVRGEILETMLAPAEPSARIILYQALLKTDKFEWVLQKGAELGIAAFIPLLTARVVVDKVSKQKYARWAQIVTEAAEQSGRGKLPRVETLQTFDAALAVARTRGGARWVLWEEENTMTLKQALAATDAETIQLFVGPEGGLTATEIETARGLGAPSVTLGPRILRAETAGLVAASAILFARGDLERAARAG